ncbi:YjbQ family protein [bacterium]|jgi:secondary thiamine-phosphate synthase enzyme|nr:YjbQ family protein [bacterium]MBT6832201.1 YjbQ family protein [bacterium]MBT6996146.1 YjbQ family protein [bacterium]MBT7772226.1 YjbQ family protein [bacterium]
MQHKILKIRSEKFFDVRDLTDEVSDFLKKISAQDGIVQIFTRHTTTAIKINELESGLLQDLKKVFFEEIAKIDRNWNHNNFETRDPRTMCAGDECKNGHSHVIQMLLGSSESVPVFAGKMQLGEWQRILFFELDRPRDREVVLSFLGKNA